LNGNPLGKTWFSHDEIRNGSKLVLEMRAEPNKSWGTKPADAPPSIIKN